MPNYFKCRFLENNFNDFFNCIGWRTWNYEEYGFKFLNLLTGKFLVFAVVWAITLILTQLLFA